MTGKKIVATLSIVGLLAATPSADASVLYNQNGVPGWAGGVPYNPTAYQAPSPASLCFSEYFGGVTNTCVGAATWVLPIYAPNSFSRKDSNNNWGVIKIVGSSGLSCSVAGIINAANNGNVYTGFWSTSFYPDSFGVVTITLTSTTGSMLYTEAMELWCSVPGNGGKLSHASFTYERTY